MAVEGASGATGVPVVGLLGVLVVGDDESVLVTHLNSVSQLFGRLVGRVRHDLGHEVVLEVGGVLLLLIDVLKALLGCFVQLAGGVVLGIEEILPREGHEEVTLILTGGLVLKPFSETDGNEGVTGRPDHLPFCRLFNFILFPHSRAGVLGFWGADATNPLAAPGKHVSR